MHLAVPRQVYGDLFSDGKNNSLVHGIVPSFGFAVARFFAHLTTFALIISENAINVKHFLAKNRGKGRIIVKIRQKCLKLSLF